VQIRAGVNFINVLIERFSYKIFGPKISNPKASFVVFGTKILYKKRALKTLMKLTPVVPNLLVITYPQNREIKIGVPLRVFN